MPNLVESLRNIENDCLTVSACFYIIIYPFSNYICSIVACLFQKLMIGNQFMTFHYYGSLGVEISQIVSIRQEISRSVYMILQVLRVFQTSRS